MAVDEWPRRRHPYSNSSDSVVRWNVSFAMYNIAIETIQPTCVRRKINRGSIIIYVVLRWPDVAVVDIGVTYVTWLKRWILQVGSHDIYLFIFSWSRTRTKNFVEFDVFVGLFIITWKEIIVFMYHTDLILSLYNNSKIKIVETFNNNNRRCVR